MSLLAPIIAGVSALLAGLVTLVWMDKNQPVLKKTPAPEPEPSLSDIWEGKTKYQVVAQKLHENVSIQRAKH